MFTLLKNTRCFLVDRALSYTLLPLWSLFFSLSLFFSSLSLLFLDHIGWSSFFFHLVMKYILKLICDQIWNKWKNVDPFWKYTRCIFWLIELIIHYLTHVDHTFSLSLSSLFLSSLLDHIWWSSFSFILSWYLFKN